MSDVPTLTLDIFKMSCHLTNKNEFCSAYSLFNFIDMHYIQPVHIQVKESEKKSQQKVTTEFHVKIHIEVAAETQSS